MIDLSVTIMAKTNSNNVFLMGWQIASWQEVTQKGRQFLF